ncbi:MAG: SNF2 helicase-associated domain-containing protein, partial [Acidimicrobiia bacterium]
MSPTATAPASGADAQRTPLEPTARIELVARCLVDAGKVVPWLSADGEERARSWWLPFPGIGDRDLLAGLLQDDTTAEHARAAGALADAVDRLVRERLSAAGAQLAPRRPGRRTVPQAWLGSLASMDPVLPASLPTDKVAAFAAEISAWIASGAVSLDRQRLCVRVHEPGTHPDAPLDSTDRWWLELLVQDAAEPSLIVPMAQLWAGRMPFPAVSVEDTLRSLARLATVAPELARVLDAAAPVGVALATDELVRFVDLRVEPLDEIGIHVLLPAWWTRRSRVSLRARVKGTGTKGVVTEAGLDFDRLVSFTWEAALGDQRLTKADLRTLQRAADAKQQLVQVRGEWVQVDAASLSRVVDRVGQAGEATVGELVRSSVGLGALDAGSGSGGGAGEPTDIVASGWLGKLLADVRSATIEPTTTPEGFAGQLRPYQERGLGWLGFLGRLGLGA